MAWWDNRIGPLPVWVWGVGIAGLAVVFLLLRRRGPTLEPLPPGPPLGGAPVPPSGEVDLSQLTAVLQSMQESQQEILQTLVTGFQAMQESQSQVMEAIIQSNQQTQALAAAIQQGFTEFGRMLLDISQSQRTQEPPIVIVATPQQQVPNSEPARALPPGPVSQVESRPIGTSSSQATTVQSGPFQTTTVYYIPSSGGGHPQGTGSQVVSTMSSTIPGETPTTVTNVVVSGGQQPTGYIFHGTERTPIYRGED